jgi:hypothetical protein
MAWSGQADVLIGRARALRSATPLERLDRPASNGGWSAAEVFEHLVIANESYLVMLRRVAAAGPPLAQPAAIWRPSLAGRLLVRSFRSPRRMRAPRIYRPPAPRPHVIEAFTAGMDELKGQMDRLARADWRRVRLRSPVTALVRLNLGDCFPILIAHAERHFQQIDRVLGEDPP